MPALPFETPGRIKCGTVVVPNYDTSCADYAGVLGLVAVEEGRCAPELAVSWGAHTFAGQRMTVFRPLSGAGSYVRLIEGTSVPEYVPMRSFGWVSLEISVRDVWHLHTRLLADGAFNIIGAPKHVDGFNNFIPMQVQGRAGEILYLNQVLQSMSDLDLPMAAADVDEIFIAILAAPDRAAALDFYADCIGFERGNTYSIIYNLINSAFGLAADTKSDISMTKVGRLPCIEVDQYPPQTMVRPVAKGELPPGVGMVTFLVENLDTIKAPFIAPPCVQPGALYDGRRSATLIGPAGEYVELIECGA